MAWLLWRPPNHERMKASAFTSARLTKDLITIARTTRATDTTATRTNIGGIGGTDPIIATTTIRIPVGTTIRIDRALGEACGLRFFSPMTIEKKRPGRFCGFMLRAGPRTYDTPRRSRSLRVMTAYFVGIGANCCCQVGLMDEPDRRATGRTSMLTACISRRGCTLYATD